MGNDMDGDVISIDRLFLVVFPHHWSVSKSDIFLIAECEIDKEE
jgi:hypothetical protein